MKDRKPIYLVLIGIIFLIWTGLVFFKKDKPEVIFFDVGQGDSIYIEMPGDFQVLIDGGPSSSVLEKLGEEMPFYDRTIEMVVLTHPDHDHLFGLLEVLKAYKIENILWTGVVDDTANYKEWIELVKEEQAQIIIAKAGERIILQKEPLAYLNILYPFESLEGREFESFNDTSVVLELKFENSSFLFTGDISDKVEKQLIEKYGSLESKVLKVAHHGSKTSSSSDFIEIVNPATAVISVGKNSYGHPAQEVLQRLEQFGIQVLITKELNDIKFSL